MHEEVTQLKLIVNKLDEVLDCIGWLGIYTVRVFFLIYVLVAIGAMNIGVASFAAADQSYKCKIASLMDINLSSACNLSSTNLQYKLYVPTKDDIPSNCTRFSEHLLTEQNCSYWLSDEPPLHSEIDVVDCSIWEYDKSIYQSTIISEFNLVCRREWLSKLSQIIMMMGIFFGAVLCGVASDRWGRRTTFCISIGTLALSGCASAFMPNIWLYCISRFFVGFGAIGSCISGYVYALEMTSVKHRIVIGQLVQSTFSFGFMLLAGVAYAERRWNLVSLYIAIPLIPFVFLYLFYSEESPRWLVSVDRVEAVRKVLGRMAKVNGRNLDDLLDNINVGADSMIKPKDDRHTVTNRISTDRQQTPPSTLDIVRNPTLRKISLPLFYIWFTVTCVYYGLSLNATTLDGDPFLNFFLNGLVEVPANFGGVFVIARWGRRFTISLANAVCGASLLSMMLVPRDLQWLDQLLFLVGKFAATLTFSCIYLYSSELFPTPLRGNGVGICSSMARLGAMVSQALLMLTYVDRRLPYVVFGSIASLAAVVVLWLPETNGTELPETTADVEEMFRTRRLKLCNRYSQS